MNSQQEQAYIFGTIFTLSNKLQLLGDRLDPSLTVKQWLFLAGVMKCDSGKPMLSEIAAHIGSSRQNVKKMASILEKQGFIRMEKDSCDARILRISLTDACRAHLKQREGMELRFIEGLFCGFKTDELSVLSGMLEKLDKSTDEMRRQYDEKEV